MIVSRITIDKHKLDRARRISERKADDAVEAVAREGERYIKTSFGTSPSAPGEPPGVLTGALRASIHVVNLGNLRRAVRSGVDYDAALEFGTERIAPRPFMRPGAEHIRRILPDIWNHFLEDV
jgi:hypothetical protein